MLKSLVIFTIGITLSCALSPIELGTISEESRQTEPTYRLPTNVRPLKYSLELNVDVDNNNFDGNVIINLEVTTTTASIHLNYKEINVNWSDARLTQDSSNTEFSLAGQVDRHQEQIYELVFSQTLPLGIYTLGLYFNGTIRNDLTGLYKSSYAFSNETLNETRYLAATHLEPTYARSIFPCFDEPAFKATFNVSIYHAGKYRAISNMPAKDEPELVPEKNNFYLTRFEETPVQMSTYLLAFVIAEEYESYTEDPKLLRIIASVHENNRLKFAQNFGVQSLEYYEHWLQKTYQLPKLDLVNIPDFLFGAMENWGLILFRDPYLFRDSDLTSIPVRTQQSGALLITHELAHMWFGNEVTPEFWTYTWLSEGFARFFEYYVTDKILPEWNLMHQFLVTNFQSSLSQDDKILCRAMTTEVAVPSIINDLFDYIVYAKSACVIRMFQHVMGIDAFQKALQSYLVDRSYNTTNPDHLFHHFQEAFVSYELALPDTIKNMFETWSNHPGYPLVKVTRNTSTRTILFEQSRFLVNQSEAAGQSESFPERSIPINFATSVSPNFEDTRPELWMIPKSSVESRTFAGPANDNWIIVNKQLTGYYRVQYDQLNYDLLIAEMNSENLKNIHVLNRAQLLDDAINLAKARLIDIKITFGFLNSLRREKDLPDAYAPWATANNALNYLNSYLKGHENYKIFQTFVANITSDAYANVEVNAVESRHLHRIHRLSVAKWACLMGLKSCLDHVDEMINGMIDGSLHIVDEIKDFVYCSAVKHSEELTTKLATHLLPLFLNAERNAAEINRIFAGLSCSTNQTIITSYLQWSIGDNSLLPLTQAQRFDLFRSIAAGSDVGLSKSLEILATKFIDVRNSIGASNLVTLFKELGPLMTSDQHIKWMEDIINGDTTLTGEQRDAAVAAVSRAKENIEWLKYHEKSIFDWLGENVQSSRATNIMVNITLMIVILISLLRFY